MSRSRFRHLPPSSDPQNSSKDQQRTGAVALPASKRQPLDSFAGTRRILVHHANSRVNITFKHQSELRICLEMNSSGTFYSDVAWKTLQTVSEPGRETRAQTVRYEFVVLLLCPHSVKTWLLVNEIIRISIFKIKRTSKCFRVTRSCLD